MSITEKMRKVFDACTVMAGVEPDFECVYMTKDAALLYLDEIDAENAKLREQMERLVTLLRADCDIEASWDGLRKFWSIGLTENGCLMRDRACKAEAENAKLLELVEDMLDCIQIRAAFSRPPTEEMYEMFYKRARELGVDE